MSDTILCFVPTVRDKVAGKKAWAQAGKIVSPAIASEEGAYVTGADRITMVHDFNGHDYKVNCGKCGKNVRSWFDAQVRETVDDDHAYAFDSLEVAMPCCKVTASLEDLRFNIPVMWAIRWLQVLNPQDGYSEPALERLCGQLKEVLGCEIRTIWVHD